MTLWICVPLGIAVLILLIGSCYQKSVIEELAAGKFKAEGDARTIKVRLDHAENKHRMALSVKDDTISLLQRKVSAYQKRWINIDIKLSNLLEDERRRNETDKLSIVDVLPYGLQPAAQSDDPTDAVAQP